MQTNGEIMYQFLTHLECTEFEWLLDRTNKLKQQLPVGITLESAGAQQPKKKPKKHWGYDSSEEEEKEPQKPIGYQY